MIFWCNIISNEELWMHAQYKQMEVQITLWKWKWISLTLRKKSSPTEKQAWNLKGQKRMTKKKLQNNDRG